MLYRQAVEGYSPSALPTALIGQAHPAIDLPPLAGLQSPGLQDSGLSGQVAIVNVFASWCIPCRQEHAALMQLSKDTRIKLIGINYKDNSSNALAFLRDNGNPYAAVGVDPTGREAINWGGLRRAGDLRRRARRPHPVQTGRPARRKGPVGRHRSRSRQGTGCRQLTRSPRLKLARRLHLKPVATACPDLNLPQAAIDQGSLPIRDSRRAPVRHGAASRFPHFLRV